MRRPGRLYRKYAVVLVALVAGALLVSGALELYFSVAEQQRSVARLEREQAAGAAGQIQEFVREVDLQLISTASARLTVSPAQLPTAAIQTDFLRILATSPSITDLRYIDGSGREQVAVHRLAADEIGRGVDRSQDAAFVEARRGYRHGVAALDQASWYGPVTFRNGSEPYMSIARPDPNDGGGVTAADVNLKFIYDVVSQIRVGENGRVFVVDPDGALIAHPDITFVLRHTDLSGSAEVRAARAGLSPADAFIATDPFGAASDAALCIRCSKGQVASAWQTIAPLGWTVFVEQPLADAFGPVYDTIQRIILLVLAGLVVSIAASVLLARRMVQPIHTLRESASRIGAGAFGERISLRTGDEVEDLARDFNRMSERLQESYATLEQKVEDRTRQLAEARDQLALASKNKSEFLANMSHELRTPLNAVIGFSDVLIQRLFGEINTKQEDYLRDIATSGKHLLSLVNDILDLSKVEAGKMELQPSVFSIQEVVESGAMMLRERTARRGIALTTQVDPDLEPIQADERKVKQVLFNLLSNAAKFTPEGGAIDVRAQRLDGEIHVSVRDTGVGIPPEDQAKIFEEFGQTASGARTEESTGLGLTLAKRFIELHGGRLWVESTVGKGSTFTFTLPVQSAS